MDYEKFVSREQLLTDFSSVEKKVDELGSVIIISENTPKYILTRFSPDADSARHRSSENLTGLLNGIGKRVFVQYYESFKRGEDPFVFLAHEAFTEQSKRSRMSKAKAIFENGLEKEALKIVAASHRADPDTVDMAHRLLLQYFPEEVQI